MDQNRSLRVLIADPHVVVCDGVAEVLACQPDLKVVGKTHTGQETIDLFTLLQPDVLLTERDFPDMDGCLVISTLNRKFRSPCILVFSLQEGDETIYTAL